MTDLIWGCQLISSETHPATKAYRHTKRKREEEVEIDRVRENVKDKEREERPRIF